MGSYNTQTIKVPMQVQVQVKNSIEEIKKLRAAMEAQFEQVDVSSSLGKQLAKLMAKVNQGFANIDASNLGTDLFDEADFKKVIGYINQINTALQAMRVHGSSASAAQLGLDTSKIEAATKAYRELQEEQRKYKNSSVATHNPAELQQLQRTRKDTGFHANATYAKNIKDLTTKRDELRAQQAELESAESTAAREQAHAAFEEASRLADEAEEKYREAQEAARNAATEVERHKQLLEDQKAAQVFDGIKGTTRGRSKQDVILDYQAALGKAVVNSRGNYTQGGKAIAKTIATWLDMSDAEIEVLLQQKASEVAVQLNQRLSESMAKNIAPLTAKIKSAQTGYNQDAHAKAQERAVQAQLSEATTKTAYEVQTTEKSIAERAYNEAKAVYNKTQDLLQLIDEQLKLLEHLAQKLDDSADEKFGERLGAARAAIDEAKKNATADTRTTQQDTGEKIAVETKKVQQLQSDNADHNRRNAATAEAERVAAQKAQQEAESFKAKMQATIKQWISVQVIVNKIKQGIRQAITDIEGLDKAMTNIAVVTDMSIDELWGKINEYMSIAQQYGVTTQGVYEVSQLYYQQGLSSAEVMAATTETLKMARIAGMGYAEAADAMTVAIRAFKMEMSDVSHITDVYSKVAAVTASDTEELATAMSKTASSAESVGSSFENTTAMLAVMIETTRESAQNLGSALKSIISRYGEMKVGLTVDSEGEDIDYNKVDTALKSVGISIKDAQGQFRDFDDVIFELSEKWDSLDKNTQRYIATIMAGNRQQSRFIALVDNWERLDEVASAAQDSEDAGLLQYAKTLDSLETKLNNIKTSFQQFYMSIINGPFIGTILEFVNNLIQGLNRLGSLQGILNLVSLITGLRSGLSLIGNLFANMFGGIITDWRSAQDKMVKEAFTYGQKKARAERAGYESVEESAHLENIIDDNTPGKGANTRWGKDQSYSFGVRNKNSGRWGKHFQYKTEGRATAGKITGAVTSLAGTTLSAAGTAVAANNPKAGALMSMGGNTLQGVSMGAAFGPWGMAIGGILGALSGLPGVLKSFNENNQRQFEYEQAKQKAEKANIKRAEAKDSYTSLKAALEKYDSIKTNRFNGEEEYQAWLDINNQLAEAYPELISYIDAEGNAIVDVTNASKALEGAMQKAATASKDYYRYKEAEYKALISVNENYTYSDTVWDSEATVETYKRLGLVDKDTTLGPTYHDGIRGREKGYKLNDLGATAKQGTYDYVINNQEIKWEAKGIADAWEALGLDPQMILYAAMGGLEGDIYKELANSNNETDQRTAAWVEYLLSSKGLANKIFTKDDDNITGWESHFSNILTGKSGLAELSINADEGYQSALYWKTEESIVDNSLMELSGATAVIGKFLRSQGYTESTDIDEMSVEEYDQTIKPLIDALNAVRPEHMEELSNIYDQLDQYSQGQLQQAFTNFGGADASNPLWQAYSSLWMDQNYQNAYKYGNALQAGFDTLTYTKWLQSSGQEDTGNNRSTYYYETLGRLDPALQTFITNHTSDVIEGYIDILENAENISNKGAAGKVAASRADFIKGIVGELDADGTYGDLTLEQTNNFLKLLTADNAGTQEWADAVEEYAQEYSIQISDIDQYVFENFNTRYQGILDTNEDILKLYQEYGSKQQSGFSTAEAEKIAKELGGNNALISDWFEVTKDGLLVLKDFDFSINELYETRKEEMKTLQTNISTAQDIFGEIKDQEMTALFSGAFSAQDIEFFLIAEGTDQELAETLSELIATGKLSTEQEVNDWLKAYYENLEIVIDTEFNVINAVLKAARKRQKVTDLQTSAETKGVDFDKIAARDKILSKGLTGYTAEEMGSLALEYNWIEGKDYRLDTNTGTFAIMRSSAQQVLGNFDGQLTSLIEDKTNSTLNDIKGLGKLVATGEDKGQYNKIFDTAAQMGINVEEELPKAITQAIEGDSTYLRAFIIDKIYKDTNVMPNADVVDAAIAEMIANYKDGVIDNALHFIELQKKVLDGIASETDKLQLAKLEAEINTDWSSELKTILLDTSKTTAEKYAAIVAAVAALEVPWSEIETYTAETFSLALNKALYGYEAKNVSTYKAVEDFENAEGRYRVDTINSWLTQMQAEAVAHQMTDVNFTNILGSYFTSDGQGNLVWAGDGTTTDIREILKTYFPEGNPAWLWLEPFIQSLEAAEKAKITNDKIELNNLQDSVNTTVNSLFNNAADATLKQVVGLYESVHGEGSFDQLASEQQQEYQDALTQAAYGNLEPLKELINSLVASNPDLDTSDIKTAYTDANAAINKQFLDYSIKSITGTLTATEQSWLKNFALDDIDGWQKTLTSALGVKGAKITDKYAAAIKAAVKSESESDLSWEQIQNYVSDAYKYQLSYLATKLDFKDLNTHQAIREIEDAAGYYSEDVLSSLFTQITRETGKAVDISKFANYFQYDKQTGTWIKRAGTDIAEFYRAVTEEEIVPEWLKGAFDASEAQHVVDTALNNESKGKSITGTIEELIRDASDVTLESLISLYEDINGESSFKDSGMLAAYSLAIEQAEAGNVELLRSQLLALVEQAKAKGYDIDISALNAAYEDAIYSLIEGLISAIKKGIEGTLSASEYSSLMQQYSLSGKATKTANGLQLNAADQRKLIAEMYKQANANGSISGLGKQVWDSFGGDSDKLLGTYESVANEIKYITKQIDEFGNNPSMADQRKEAEAYLAVLRQIEEAAYLDPDNPIFNFMDQKATDGYTDNFDNYIESIDKVKTAFASLQEKGGYITYNDFYDMMDFLNTSGQWDSFAQQVNLAGRSYEDFVNSVVANTDKWGHVNIEGIAVEMGISVDAAMEAMNNNMTEGLKTVAKQQIKYLSGLETMLEAFAALEGLGELDLSLNITTSLKDEDGNSYKITHLSEIADKWDELKSLDDRRNILEQANTVVRTASNSNEGKKLMDSFREAFGLNEGFEDITLMDLFFGGEITEDNIGLADAFGTLAQELPNLTSGQLETIAIQMKAAFGNLLGENGEFLGTKAEWESIIQDFFTNLNFNAIPETINSQISAAAANNQVTEIVAGKAKLVFGENGITFEGEDLEQNKQALIQQLQDMFGIAVEDIQVGENKEVSFISPTITAETKTLTSDFESIADAAEGVITAMNTLQGILDAFQVSEQFREFAHLVSSMYGNPEATDGSTDMGMQVVIDTSDALNAITNFQASFETMKAAIEGKPIVIRATGSSFSGATVQTQGPAQTNVPTTTETVTRVSQIISVTYETTNEAPEVVTPQYIDYYWRAKGSIPVPTDKIVSFTWKDTNPLNNWYTVSNPATVNFKWNAVNKPGSLGITPTAAVWTGTMNDISGRALADGSLSRLYSGAELAQKTLVGELGPELAVYDGEYHMLGARGAEFVDLPSDAIIFNHLQTAGIMKGQMNVRGKAMADGNIHGPALAGGASAALASVQRAKAVWQGLLNSLSVADLLGATGGGGGGGSDESIKGVAQELQEWYNLSRQIADLEAQINTLLKERANIPERDGATYLKSLREEQSLLAKQVATEEILLGYQELQLKRQAEHINTNDIWSRFLEVDENGLLQYKEGNEANGGKGALKVLQDFNKMSGEEQQEYLKQISYSYTDQDGNVLEGSELATKFYEELQEQIDTYDSLYDTVNNTEGKLEELATSINEINEEIKENQMDLEQEIFDILVEAQEAEIEALEEQKELIEEANEAYINGLQKALQTERDMYSDNERLADREQLQRQLSLLRRSGGSASEIAFLEEQLDSMLKEEYFSRQEDMIQNIQDANDEQIRLLDEQIRLEQESLEYQKENGILWSKVYEIMSGSTEDILAFMQGNKPEFFSQSTLQQEQMLTAWAKKVGIYTENRKYEEHESYAKEDIWDTGAIWSQDGMSNLKSIYEGLSAEGKETVRNQFASAYAQARINGNDHDTATKKAREAIQDTLEGQQGVNEGQDINAPTNTPGAAAEFMYIQGSNKLNLREQANKKSKSLGTYSSGTKVKILKKENEDWYKVEVNGQTGYMMAKYLTSTKPGGDTDEETNGDTKYRRQATVTYVKADGTTGTVTGKGVDASKRTAEQIALRYAKSKIPAGGTYQSVKYSSYSKGGLVDYTGLALVHGKPSQPEAFLNTKQTAMITEAVKSMGDGGALDGIKATLAALNSTIRSIVNNNTTQTSSFTVAPGAVTIQVAQLNDSYDVEELSKDVMNRMVAIASKSTNRGVNRR